MTSYKEFLATNRCDEILKSIDQAGYKKDQLVKILSADHGRLFSTDSDLVVFGSMGRDEVTAGSDVDWTLLVDGQAKAEHRKTTNYIAKKLKENELIEPGNSGMFGNITFSHDLIHYIGGEDDTNHNLTRRILLLLESEKIILSSEVRDGHSAYDRVLKGIIEQYVDNDSGYKSPRENNPKFPRFLLNDFIRFWRTMCVDFAFKQKEQEGKKWAIRNIKLRMSRKIIYIKGLLMCFRCYNGEGNDEEESKSSLYSFSQQKALQFIFESLRIFPEIEKELDAFLNRYNIYLMILNNEENSKHLRDLNMDNAYSDRLFNELRDISDEFQKSLKEIFFIKETPIKEFIIKYGLF